MIFRHKLYINEGVFTTETQQKVSRWSFSISPEYSYNVTNFNIQVHDSLELTIINKTLSNKGFILPGFINSTIIEPLDSVVRQVVFSKPELHIFYDPIAYPTHFYMGLAGTINVQSAPISSKNKPICWYLSDLMPEVNSQISNNKFAHKWKNYSPSYFLINSKTYPDTQYDPLTRIHSFVGDTILLNVINFGMAKHVLHFYGFHLKVLSSNNSQLHTHSSRDTFPLGRMQYVCLQLVTDKAGLYSVHNMNATSELENGYRPNGMFLIMRVDAN